jgi:hypothetical protein
VVTVSFTKGLKVAVTCWFMFIANVQGSPEHAPLQPRNPYGGSGVAVSVTEVPQGNEAEQMPPLVLQFSPPGVPVTVPVPVPFTATCNGSAKLAATCASALSVREQAPVPEQVSPHPRKVAAVFPPLLLSGVSARLTVVPAGKP